MEPDEHLLEAWENGVALGDAWWAFADLQKKKRFRELQQAASPSDPAPHMGFRHGLEDEVISRLSSGELQAFGIEIRSAGELIAISKNYFWKGAKIDFDNDTVASLGRKFGQVTVQGKREPIVETLPEVLVADPRLIRSDRVPDEATTEAELIDPRAVIHGASEMPPREPAQIAKPASSNKPNKGRPPVIPEVREVVRELMARDRFTGLRTGEIERLVATTSRDRFPKLFPKPTQPSRNVIYRALREEGWSPPPAKSSS
jgi:hypothetical protein